MPYFKKVNQTQLNQGIYLYTNPNSFKDLISTKPYKTGTENLQQVLKEKVQNVSWLEHRQ